MKYVINENPQPAIRPRFGNGHCYDSQKLLKTMISLQIAKQHADRKQYTGPLAVYIQFHIALPQGKKNRVRLNCPHIFKPDIDNLAKLLLDCLTRSRIIRDDCIICELHATKDYHPKGATVFEIIELPNSPEKVENVAKEAKITESNTSK